MVGPLFRQSLPEWSVSARARQNGGTAIPPELARMVGPPLIQALFMPRQSSLEMVGPALVQALFMPLDVLGSTQACTKQVKQQSFWLDISSNNM